MKWALYLTKILKILFAFFSLGGTIWPSLYAIGLYSGLGVAIASLFTGLVSSLTFLYSSFSQWSGGWSSSIVSFFNEFQDNGWFSLLSFIFSIDVPVRFISTVVGTYVSFAVTGVLALMGTSVIISFGVVGVIWVRRRVKMIVAGFGTHS